MLHYTEKPVFVGMKLVNTYFIGDPQINHQATRKPRRQPDEVDDKRTLETFEVAIN
jgi:hypothetical protein